MKAILLGAGKGTRISRMVKAVPKCTLPIDGKPLIKITVDMLEKQGIATTVCVGYCQNYIKQALKMFQYAKNLPIVSEQIALQKLIKEDLAVLTSFCKLNGIVVKKGKN